MARIIFSNNQLTQSLHVRSGLKAGQAPVVCYQYVNGAWYPVSNVYPPSPVPTPPPQPPSAQWLNCQSCTGTVVGNGQLQNATCEVCTM